MPVWHILYVTFKFVIVNNQAALPVLLSLRKNQQVGNQFSSYVYISYGQNQGVGDFLSKCVKCLVAGSSGNQPIKQKKGDTAQPPSLAGISTD